VSEVVAGPEDHRFELLADNAPVMIWRADTTRACDFFNKPWLEFTGRSLEQEIGQGWAEGVHPEDIERCRETHARAFDARSDFSMHYRLRRHDGAYRWLLDNGRPYYVGDVFAGYFGSCIDITEMKTALDERRRALSERETLLAELQHRVKNNAQATTSFLSLQASRASSPEVAAALRGAATRILLATLVQDRMFQVTEHCGVDLGAELETTARGVMEIVGRPGIQLDTRLEAKLVLPVAQAMPVLLIVDELVVNAARHAFPEGREGRIRLGLRRAGPGLGEVVVSDDGIGIADLEDRQTPQGNLGLHLIRRLARQARATLRIAGGHGTRATLLFAAP
jgi:PAS domain S-box-containing protein